MQTREESDLTASVLRDFCNTTFKYFNGYSYVAGVLETILWDISRDLPEQKREDLRNRIQYHTTEYLKKIVLEGPLKVVK